MSTFDDKGYEYIKNATGGGESDISFPVGMSIKLASGTSVPSTGTWELIGIHGQHYPKITKLFYFFSLKLSNFNTNKHSLMFYLCYLLHCYNIILIFLRSYLKKNCK